MLNRAFRLITLLLVASLAACNAQEADPEPTSAPEPPAVTPATSTEVSWRTYHGDAALTGYTDAVLPDRLVLNWRYQAGDRVYNPPVTEGMRWYLVTLKGKAIAIDMNGEEVWNEQYWSGEKPDGTPREAVFDSPPAIFGNTLYLASSHGTVYAIDPATGETRWKKDTEGNFQGTPNWVTLPSSGKEAVCFISQSDGTLLAFDPKSGEQLWEALGPERCDGSVATLNGKIVFGSCAAALHVLSAENGEHEKDIAIDEESQVAGGVALVGDTVFSGSRSGKFIHASLTTGEVLWTNINSQDEIFTTPAISDKYVVFTSRDGKVHCADRKSGDEVWTYEVDGEPGSPVIAKDKVVVTSGGFIYILGLADGKRIWQRKVSDEISSPAVLHNMVVVGGEDGAVTAFGLRTPREG